MEHATTFDAYRKSDVSDLGAAAHESASRNSSWITEVLAICQGLLVVRILSLLLFASLLPLTLPTIGIHLDNTHQLNLPLSGMDRDVVVLIIGIAAALELYLVHRLADRNRWARLGVLAFEPLVIIAATVALSLGAAVAAIPLALSVSAVCLLLLNRVRSAYRLEPHRDRLLTGHRRGGIFPGYAPLPPGALKPAQTVGYSVEHPPED